MATEIARTVVTDEASLIATAPGSLNEGEVYSVSIQNQGEGTVTLGGEDVTAGAGRVDVDPNGADVGRVTLAAGEELWAVTDGDPATIFGTAGVLAGQTSLVAGSGGGAAIAQALLVESEAQTGVAVSSSGPFDPVVIAGTVDALVTSANIADFLTTNEDDHLVFTRDCIVMGTLRVDLDNDVTDSALGELLFGPIGSGLPRGSVSVPVGEHRATSALFVWGVTEGEALQFFFTNGYASPNVFYGALKLFLVG